MLSDKMLKALNDQIEMEFNSAYLYLAMAAQFDDMNLPGFAHWMKLQYQEEISHGMKLFDYINNRRGRVVLGPIAQPDKDFGNAVEVFEQVLAHEQKVTASIHKLYEQAHTEKDYATQSQLHWFIDEQVEEENTADEILNQLKAIEGKAHLMLMLDRQLASRGAG